MVHLFPSLVISASPPCTYNSFKILLEKYGVVEILSKMIVESKKYIKEKTENKKIVKIIVTYCQLLSYAFMF